MDSSSCQRASSVSSNRENRKKASTMVQSRRAEFFASYKRQDLSLPGSTMFYMAKNPTSPEVYEKMIQSCKYFYVKNPVLVIPELHYVGDDKWEISGEKNQLSSSKISCDLSKIASELWIADRLLVHTENPNILSSLMPKLYRCDAKFVFIVNQIISCHELSFLISSAKTISIGDVTVKDEKGLNLAVEKIVEVAVKAKSIEIWSYTVPSNITSETMKKLIRIPHFAKLNKFFLDCLPEAFDLESFYCYMKKNQGTKFHLRFAVSISEAYENRLGEIVDEILSTENRGYKPPLIGFVGLDIQKLRKLERIFYSRY